MKQVSVELDESLYKEFSKKCIDLGVTRRDAITCMIKAWISVGKGEKE